MSELKAALLDAKYIDMISLGDFVVRDCGLPDMDSDGNLMPQATEIAAALFRWAADVPVEAPAKSAAAEAVEADLDDDDDHDEDDDFIEYDENGDPLMDADEAERLEAEKHAAEGEERD